MDLSTSYLGLKLNTPLMPGSSPMTDDLDTVRKLVDHGAGALVMHSIYEEQITRERTDRLWYEGACSNGGSHGANGSYHFSHTPREYLDRIAAIKRTVNVPLIASINCTTKGKWLDYATLIESAGADALELNIYFLPTNPDESAADVERKLIGIVAAVREQVTIPIAVKLSPFYTSLPHLARQLYSMGANGLVLFNRFYQPDFELASRSPHAQLRLSHAPDPTELRLRLRWLAILSPVTRMSLALTGGLHTGLEATKGIMAGASAIQVVSSLLIAGPEYMETILEGLEYYMREAGVDSVSELKGCMNQARSGDAAATERGGYLSMIHSWNMKGQAERREIPTA